MSDRATLVQIYIAFYNRAPDPEGLGFWQGACDDGLSLPEIAELFVPQDESIGTYPFLGNPTEEGIRSFLQSVYENLFNREIDAAGETFWTNQILKSLSGEPGGLSIGEVLLSIITGAQGDDITTLDNKTTIALDFHDQAAALDGYMQNPAATTASRLALSVVDETDFSVVQGKVLNENYFEEFDGAGNPLLDPFMPGVFDPIVGPGQTALDEAPVNGILPGSQQDAVVAVLADGRVVTVYEERFTSVDLAFNIRNADGSLTIPDVSVVRALGLDPFNTQFTAPEITALPDGGFIILAEGGSAGALPGGLYALRFNAAGEVEDDPVLVVGYDDFFYFDGYDVTYLPTGNILYTFSGDPDDLDFEDAFFKIMTPEGATVVDTQVVNSNDATDEDEDEPAGAALPDGTFLIVYSSGDAGFDGSGDAIVGRLHDADGNPLGGDFVLNEIAGGDQRSPAVSALGEDRFVVVFQTFSGTFDPQINGLSAVIVDRNGSIDVDEFPINQLTQNDQRLPQVTELQNGNFVVVWESSDSGVSDIRARVFEDDGTPVTGDILVNTLTNLFQNRPEVAATEDGFVVTWQNAAETIDDPFGSNIRMAAFDEDGVRLPLPNETNPSLAQVESDEFQVNDEVAFDQGDPSVVGLADGRSVFSYYDGGEDGGTFEVRDADGSLLQADMLAMPGSGALEIEMVATPDGGFVMVGRGFVPDGLGAGILLQVFDETLTPGAVIRVNQTALGTGTSREPEVAIDPDGNIIVGWTFKAGAADSVVKLRKFDADGTPLDNEVTVDSALAPGLDLRALTVNGDGTVLAVAETENAALSGTSGDDLFIALLDGDLDPQVRKLLPISHLGDQGSPTVAPLEDGNFLVVMDNTAGPADPLFQDLQSDVTGIIIDSNGDAVGGEFIVGQTTQFNQRTPDATVLSDGRVLVTWAGENPPFSQDIFGLVFDADGTPVTGEFLLNDRQDANQTLPDVSAAGDGFVVSWVSDLTFDASTDPFVAGAIFDGNFDPVSMPLVVSNKELSFLSEDDILAMQDIPLDGSVFEITGFGADTALGAMLSFDGPGVVEYNPFTLAPEINNLAPGDQLTEIFTYTVENEFNETVTLVGSFQVQGFEDVM